MKRKTTSLKSLTSPRDFHPFQHHEAAPRRLLKRLNLLVHGRVHRKPHPHPAPHIQTPNNASSVSLSRGPSLLSAASRLSRPPLTAEPDSFVPNESLADQRACIKIRLATFNMHDQLPSSSGDLRDLLGDISSCPNPPKRKKRGSSHSSAGGFSSRGSILTIPTEKELPKFPLTAEHPYHVIVVASQECPTASGVLAGKVRTLDGKGWTSILESYLCGGSFYNDSDSGSGSSGSEGDDDGEGSPSEPTHGDISRDPAPPDARGVDSSSILSRATGATSQTQRNEDEQPSQAGASSAHGSRSSSKGRRKRGPYVLVEKERLMGIYIAVFVARSCEDLIEGVSKSRVPAGLIGGRLGNKGGVGVSLYFASSRLLFVSAHLAAHASGLEIRKANALKILDELDVDDYYEASGKIGPKPKNITDRFDQTFFLGDLNFRLNVSRLHADWLIRGKDYVTALQFDQLKDVLAEANSVFKGFSEGEITFAPTYKYDVVHPVKKKRSALLRSKSKRYSRDGGKLSPPLLDSDASSNKGSATDPEVMHGTSKPGDDDALSVISSAGTISTMSAFDPIERSEIDRADLTSLGLPTAPTKGDETHMDAVRKAQIRFLTLVRSNSAAAALAHARSRSGSSPLTPKSAPAFNAVFPPRPMLQASQSAVVVPMRRSTSSPTGYADMPAILKGEKVLEEPMALQKGKDVEEEKDTERGKGLAKTKSKVESVVAPVEPVFDSSSKQRVQSYTDRILFKSTVVPPDEPEEAAPAWTAPPLAQSRSAIFADALRNLAHPSAIGAAPTFQRPSAEEADERSRRRRASAEDRQLKFGDLFTRPRFKSMSTDSLAPSPTFDAPPASNDELPTHDFPRTKSLQPSHLVRRNSAADSTGTNETNETANRKKAFWKRVASFPSLGASPSSPTDGEVHSETVASPLASPDLFTATATSNSPTLTGTEPSFLARRPPPRKMFTLSANSPPSSPDDVRSPIDFPSHALTDKPAMARSNSDSIAADSPAGPSGSSRTGFPRSATFAPSHRVTRSVSGGPPMPDERRNTASSASLNSRFKLFLNSLPLPFLSTTVRPVQPPVAAPTFRTPKTGPRPGEIEVIKYDSVADLTRMAAVSDHRPVYLVCAVGVHQPVEEDER
ncbi:hypothetical protein JCM1841_004306 [Sporobolomyces salmonicolor]